MKEHNALLKKIRVLDLTDEKGLLAGRLLGDMGADVIKVEKPGGDSARNIGPFYHDIPDPEKSLFWFALNYNKRSITLDIDTQHGKDILEKLIKTADIVIESFSPGYLKKIGLSYSRISEINPGTILTSISPFGSDGPYKDFKGAGIVCEAMGGLLYATGDPDRPPVVFSHHPQAYYMAGADAAAGALIALYHRELIGRGQHVEISVQQSVEWCTYFFAIKWDINHELTERMGTKFHFQSNEPFLEQTWQCKDGYVRYVQHGGRYGPVNGPPMAKWLETEGLLNDAWKSIDFKFFDWAGKPQELVEEIEKPLRKLFLRYTKAQLYQEAAKRGLMLSPVYTVSDIMEDVQLKSRGYWKTVEHSELGDTLTYPGSFAISSIAPSQIIRRAPLIGEHNHEIYLQELGLTHLEIEKLKQSNII